MLFLFVNSFFIYEGYYCIIIVIILFFIDKKLNIMFVLVIIIWIILGLVFKLDIFVIFGLDKVLFICFICFICLD